MARPRQIFQDATTMLLFSIFSLSSFSGEFASTSLALLSNLQNSLELLEHAFDKFGMFVGLILCSVRYEFAFEILCCLFRFPAIASFSLPVPSILKKNPNVAL